MVLKMTLLLPISTDPLDDPDHSFLHRAVAIDSAATEQTMCICPTSCGPVIQNNLYIGTPEGTTGCLYFYNATNNYKSGFKGGVPGSAADLIWYLPVELGSGNYILSTDGSGNLCWFCTCYCVCAACYSTASAVEYIGGNCGCFVCYIDFGTQTAECTCAFCDFFSCGRNVLSDYYGASVICG